MIVESPPEHPLQVFKLAATSYSPALAAAATDNTTATVLTAVDQLLLDDQFGGIREVR